MGFTEDLIKGHEGLRLKAYRDLLGIWTIGYGCNLEAFGAKVIFDYLGLDYQALRDGKAVLNQAHADAIFEFQMVGVRSSAGLIFGGYAKFMELPEKVQAVVCDLIFNV